MGSLKSCVYGLGMLVLGYSSFAGEKYAENSSQSDLVTKCTAVSKGTQALRDDVKKLSLDLDEIDRDSNVAYSDLIHSAKRLKVKIRSASKKMRDLRDKPSPLQKALRKAIKLLEEPFDIPDELYMEPDPLPEVVLFETA
ncbi:hypothetical protein HN832_04965 [archaeon]|jgi:hypothetical protein|nr:hypothetical protein [archaeon]MBT4374039.1 hypothetical protein [archaeon]MBT4532135.1 hypothetical protein [archaeon]MBT7002025.1 hypothetical protein [archaeon]MBT7282736.1 hypothetical protein [archaeon]